MATKTVEFLRNQIKGAHEILEGTLQGVTFDQAHWTPPGLVNPLGANYGHILVSEDGTINGLLKGAAPLLASSWAGKVGLSELPPMPGPGTQGLPAWDEWARRVKVDLDVLHAYAQAVYAATDNYLASLTDEDLGRSLDLSVLGEGQQTVGWLLSIVLSNANWHTGEISCLKGLQGVRGYPM